MKRLLFLLPLLLTAALHAAPPAKPPIPAVPPVLEGVAGIRGNSALGELGVALRGGEPLTEEQWAALESVPLRAYAFSGKVLDNAGLARLAKIGAEKLVIEGGMANDEGAANFTAMKSLKLLVFSHSKFGAKTAEALAKHPALETFRSDGRCGAVGMEHIATAPKLRTVRLMHSAANDQSAKALANHPTLEVLGLNSSNSFDLSDAALQAIGTMRALKELSMSDTVLTYDGGLKRLKDLPNLTKVGFSKVGSTEADLAKLKADLPKINIVVTEPMTPEERAKWEKSHAYHQAKALQKPKAH